MKILVIEDERVLLENIRQYFSGEGYICETANNLKLAIDKIGLYEYDCIVLDIGLPDGSGLEVLKYLKETDKDEGIVIISAKNSLEDKLSGLNLGADDYIIKPFHLAELRARIMAVYRRRMFKGTNVLKYETIEIDMDAMEVSIQGHPVFFTRKEYEMLLYFIANKGKVVSRTALTDSLWRDEVNLGETFDFIYTHIKNIRKKLIDHTGKDYFRSVYGIGYRFN